MGEWSHAREGNQDRAWMECAEAHEGPVPGCLTEQKKPIVDGSIQAKFKKQLTKRLQAPHVPSARLEGDLQNTCKVKLRDVGYRLVYEVIDQRLVVAVIAVGRRDPDAGYLQASGRAAP